ncbi:P2X purinoceptor 3 isoform X1 [Apus apus]|uniref:P2X purinoceptor 3 isoform X1 n=1 Tax=Apus apus TaxID=8895 RepID=UPI0021F8F59A|nr:P2X purinoceptor 3 isoform X1 [Apus apus]
MSPPRPLPRCPGAFFSYETTKAVVVRSRRVGVLHRALQFLILAYFIGWVFLHEKAYQVRETAIESSVVTKVKGVGHYAGRVLDTADYVTPPPGCLGVRGGHQADPDGEPGAGAVPGGRPPVPLHGRSALPGDGLCHRQRPIMLEAENFTLLIKNSVRFPLFGFEKNNLPPPGSGGNLSQCRFHPQDQPLCPILRLGDIARMAGQDFPTLAATGGVLGIKIGWVCDLDLGGEHCLPHYSFTRLDGRARAPASGYNFRHARYYRLHNGTEHRTLTKAFGIRFDVLVYGNAGKFSVIPTLINAVAAFTSIGVGTVLCDIILLNCLHGAEHYKARKFEEVPEVAVPAPPTSPTARTPEALGGCPRDPSSDSGTGSFGL